MIMIASSKRYRIIAYAVFTGRFCLALGRMFG